MKFGMRKPNFKKSIKARTTGKIKRIAKRSVNPLYGKKRMGYIKNPKKAIKNKIYNKTTFSIMDIFKWLKISKKKTSSNVNIKTKVTLNDIDRMNSIEKTKLYQTISIQYREFYNKYYESMQKAKEYYSMFINNNLENKYYEKILENCNYVLSNVEQFRNLEMMNNKLTGEKDLIKSNDAYVILSKAYEKMNEYDKALEVCEEAIKNGFTNDGTKAGYAGRAEKIKLKINQQKTH